MHDRLIASGPQFRQLALTGILVLVGLGIAPTAARAQITMSLPTNLTAHPGDTINVPLNLSVIGNQLDANHGNGIGAASFVMSYNSSAISGVGTISLGTLISNTGYGFSNYTTNITPSLIQAVTSSSVGTPGLSAGTTGTLASIPLTISNTAAPGTYAIKLFASSGPTTTSLVDNNFNTYDINSGLTLVDGVITVTAIPEPSGILLLILGVYGIGRCASSGSNMWASTRNQFKPSR